MKRYKRGHLIYNGKILNVNLYKDTLGNVVVALEGDWYQVKYNKNLKVWVFKNE